MTLTWWFSAPIGAIRASSGAKFIATDLKNTLAVFISRQTVAKLRPSAITQSSIFLSKKYWFQKTWDPRALNNWSDEEVERMPFDFNKNSNR